MKNKNIRVIQFVIREIYLIYQQLDTRSISVKILK